MKKAKNIAAMAVWVIVGSSREGYGGKFCCAAWVEEDC